ncbi:MAG: hypothetical protein P4L46_16355 [Fimbriimonas sp.]|nr:hypothetical protein [Fimbriimonas sp.]
MDASPAKVEVDLESKVQADAERNLILVPRHVTPVSQSGMNRAGA